MKYNRLGKTGIRISELCLGTMAFGHEADEQTSAGMFHLGREKGINVFDTADVYNNGRSEEILGDLIQQERDQLILTSKVTQRSGKGINEAGSSRRHIMLSVEKSLRRLKTDRIDLYFLHRFDPDTDIDETLRALDDLVAQGKVVYTGASNWAAWQIMKALKTSEHCGYRPFSCIQPMYNLLKRQAEVELLPMAMSEGLGVISYSPVGAGVLTGKYCAGIDTHSRLGEKEYYSARYSNPEYFTIADKFAALAKAQGVHPGVLAIAWVKKNEAITAPIIGARNVDQLAINLQAVDYELSDDVYRAITDLTPMPPIATDRLEEQIGKGKP